ncbi:hypothetical protein K438DRAFT_1938298, partial [Mycena galopus ATCC 62051]
MSSSSSSNDTSPGGEIQTIILFNDREGRCMAEYSWSGAAKSASRFSDVKLCSHDPHDDRRCELTCSPTTPRFECFGDIPRRPTRCSAPSSRGSDATVDEIFERPYADPKVSPGQLPPLCDDVDSDDEVLNATYAPATADDIDDEPPIGLYLLSKTASWVAELATDSPTQMPAELSQTHFTFVPPSTAPKFPSPLRVECSKDTPVSTIQTLALVASLALNKPLFHPRPSSDPEHFEPDQSL